MGEDGTPTVVWCSSPAPKGGRKSGKIRVELSKRWCSARHRRGCSHQESWTNSSSFQVAPQRSLAGLALRASRHGQSLHSAIAIGVATRTQSSWCRFSFLVFVPLYAFVAIPFGLLAMRGARRLSPSQENSGRAPLGSVFYARASPCSATPHPMRVLTLPWISASSPARSGIRPFPIYGPDHEIFQECFRICLEVGWQMAFGAVWENLRCLSLLVSSYGEARWRNLTLARRLEMLESAGT